MLICLLTVVRALKGRINSAQCAAKRSVGKKTGQPPRRRAESLNEYEFGCPFVIPNAVRNLTGEREEILRFALNDKRRCPERRGTSPPLQRGKSGSEGGMLSLWKGECKGLKADRSVTALKGRVNSVQCAAKRSVGKQGDPLGGGLKA